MGESIAARTTGRTLSTRTVWNVLDLSGCQIAVILWERSASRRRMVSTVKGSWAGRESNGGSGVEEGTGSEDGGTSRPATNITGASCTTSSGGYEFILRSRVVVQLDEARWRNLKQHPHSRKSNFSLSISSTARYHYPPLFYTHFTFY